MPHDERPVPGVWREGRLELDCGGRRFVIRREADLEALWDAMDQTAFGGDERLPYWAELWPAGVFLAQWFAEDPARVAGLRCLDLGCGLGYTALAAAWLGGRVLGVDYEPEAVRHAVMNARRNGLADRPLAFACMDWRRPGLAPGAFERIWGGDVVYERRFFEPLERLFAGALAPGGLVWIAEPVRDVSRDVWADWAGRGWAVRRVDERMVPLGAQRPRVRLWELRRPDHGFGRVSGE
ncbi:MAG: methyltransferase [Desulfovibrionaceae bacterium]